MALNVYTNVISLTSQRNLNVNSKGMNQALQRLSSGLRINSASDDAAGLAISNGLTAQIRGLNQAIRNAGDGLSLLGTAEGAIIEQSNILQRLRELAVQSASDTNSANNRSAINNEATQLKNELDRIAKTVQFNGINLLDGSFTAKDIQVGANAGPNERIAVDLESTRSSAIGIAYKLTGTGVVSGTALVAGELTITANGTTTSVGASTSDGVSTANGDASALAYANAINAVSGQTGVRAEASTTVTGGAQNAGGGTPAGQIDAGEILINGVDIGAVTITGNTDTDVIDAINSKSSSTGVTAALGGVGGDTITLTAADGRNITVAVSGDGGTISGLASATTRGTLTVKGAGAFSVTDTAGNGVTALSGSATKDTANNISTIDISTKTKANEAISVIDVALENLNTRRAQIGAQVNRINSTVQNLSVTSENLSASNSRILDADFASETAALSRSQILQQAAVAILAQANQAPQLALSLLR